MNYLIIENDTPENNFKIQQINQHIRNNKPVVIYFYKDGCPFCERTTPEWDKLPNYLSKNDNLLVARINKVLYDKVQSVGDKPMLYPNIRYVHGSHINTFKKEGDERNSKNLSLWIQQQQPKSHSMHKPIYSIKRPIHNFLKKPKYKKSLKKIKRKYNKFSKKRRQYYM
jgi:thiol-disulfide isomerase/thioredoxin